MRTIIFLILLSNATFGQDSIDDKMHYIYFKGKPFPLDSFRPKVQIVNGKKIKVLNDYNGETFFYLNLSDTSNLTVIPQTNDSYFIRNDTLIIIPRTKRLRVYSNYDINYNEDIDYSLRTVHRIKLPISEIEYVKVTRDSFKGVTGTICFLSAVSTLVVAPLVSLGSTFNSDRYYKVAGYSATVFVTTLTLNLVFGKKLFYLKKHKRRKHWTLQ